MNAAGGDGAAGLVRRFEGFETIAAADVPAWLAAEATGPASLDRPARAAAVAGGYARAFAALQEAIARATSIRPT
jgi:hypothetical protein